ncbi:MAG: hypothetical protein HYV34_04875 [Candidatus Kerfeldbacteria bacterium]|nr:hypothetical protein [Candidatus Kerfeldbacteria bacterium]
MGLHNIIPLRDGSVRFIDPHLRLSGARTLAIGSAEYDLVRFMANLTRMKFVYSWGCSAAVTNAIVNGLTGAFIELCFALVYTRYAACPCAQCTSVPGLLQTMEAESNRWLRIVERRLQ